MFTYPIDFFRLSLMVREPRIEKHWVMDPRASPDEVAIRKISASNPGRKPHSLSQYTG